LFCFEQIASGTKSTVLAASECRTVRPSALKKITPNKN
jgi:hypothetical protein